MPRIMPYFYGPLQAAESIRLVEILSDAPHNRVTCTVHEYSLAEAPPYEALSYTWGNADIRETIMIHDGHALSVTANCGSALQRLRKPDVNRFVWIDAICIDQSNTDEVNGQVAIMARIYRNASRVIIDIGEVSPTSTSALNIISERANNKFYRLSEGLDVRDYVNELYRRPWFQRIWVLQEAFWAKCAVVLCGSVEYPWEYFRPFQIWINGHEAGEREHFHPTLPMLLPPVMNVGTSISTVYRAREDFLSLLGKGRTCKATDPRDMVFAILPMLSDAAEHGLTADYNKTTTEVYTELAMWMADQVGIEFLSCVRGISDLEGLPSWAPDWKQGVRQVHLLGLGGRCHPLAASGNSVAVTAVIQSNTTAPLLKIRGLVVDIIRRVCEQSDNLEEAENAFARAAYRYRQERIPHIGRMNLPPCRESRTHEARIQPPAWTGLFGHPFRWEDGDTDNDVIDWFHYALGGRRLLQTRSGYFGFGPMHIQEGDLVCIFLGGNTPFIVRNVNSTSEKGGSGLGYATKAESEGSGLCTFVGESYIYELMDGKALTGVDMSRVLENTPAAPLEDFLLL